MWFWETSAPGPVDPRRNTSSCSNPPKASGDVQGPLKTPAMRPLFCLVYLYKLKTGFLTLLRAVFAALARDKLQGASRTVESTTTDGWRGTPHSKRDSVEKYDKTAAPRRACVQRTGGFAAGEALLHDAATMNARSGTWRRVLCKPTTPSGHPS